MQYKLTDKASQRLNTECCLPICNITLPSIEHSTTINLLVMSNKLKQLALALESREVALPSSLPIVMPSAGLVSIAGNTDMHCQKILGEKGGCEPVSQDHS